MLSREAPPRDLVERAERSVLEVAHDDRQKKFRPIARGAPRGDRQAPPAVDGQDAAHRHAVGLQGPRRDDRRLSARQPDRDRRTPVDGQVRPRREHRRERRARRRPSVPGAQPGRAVLARDVRVRARAALRRLPGPHPRRGAAQGTRGRESLAEDPRRLPAAVRGAAVDRRLERHRRARGAGQVATPAPSARGRPRADHHRLPPADAPRGPGGKPRRAGRADLPRAEVAGAGARTFR